MAYYVLGPGGAKHGPADLQTLNDWIVQGRIAPETLVEEIGSGVKTPAHAVSGLQFGAIVASPPPLVPADPPAPQGQNLQVSNYICPGLGTGGSSHNLFLPEIDSKWALHGFLSAAGSIGLAVFVTLVHSEFRLSILALGGCIYGARCGYIGLNRGESGLGALVVALNALAFVVVLALMIWGFYR